jgi:hypothetical protein
MRLRVIVFALVAIAVAVGLVLPSAGAKPPKPPKPTKPPKSTTTTVAPTTTSGTTTTTVAPTTTTLAETTTTAEATTTTAEQTTTSSSTSTTLPDLNTYLTGTAVLYGINDSEGRYLAVIYGIPGLPLYPGSDPAFVQDCPAGTTVSFSESTFIYPPGSVTVSDFTDIGGGFVAENTTDNTVTVTYKIACVPV